MTREELSGTVYLKLRVFYGASNASKAEEEIMAVVDKYVNTALSERHQRLVDAARAVLDIDDTGALSEDNKDKLFALKAALEGEG